MLVAQTEEALPYATPRRGDSSLSHSNSGSVGRASLSRAREERSESTALPALQNDSDNHRRVHTGDSVMSTAVGASRIGSVSVLGRQTSSIQQSSLHRGESGPPPLRQRSSQFKDTTTSLISEICMRLHTMSTNRDDPNQSGTRPHTTTKDSMKQMLRDANALVNLCSDADEHADIVDNGVVAVVVDLVKKPALAKEIKEYVMKALQALSAYPRARSAMLDAGCLPVLSACLSMEGTTHALRVDTIYTLFSFCQDSKDTKLRIATRSTIEALNALILNGTRAEVAGSVLLLRSLSMLDDPVVCMGELGATFTIVNLCQKEGISLNMLDDAICTLQNISAHDYELPYVIKSGTVAVCQEISEKTDSPTLMHRCLCVILNCTFSEEGRNLLLAAKGLQSMLSLVMDATELGKIRSKAASIVGAIAADDTARTKILHSGILGQMKIKFETADDPGASETISHILTRLASYERLQVPLLATGLVEILIKRIIEQLPAPDSQYMNVQLLKVYLNLLRYLANPEEGKKVVAKHGMNVFINILRDPRFPIEILSETAQIMDYLSMSPDLELEMASHDFVPAIITMLNDNKEVEHSTFMLANLARTKAYRSMLIQKGGIPALKRILVEGSGEARRSATVAVLFTGQLDMEGKRQIAEAGIIPILLANLQAEGTTDKEIQYIVCALQMVSAYEDAVVEFVDVDVANILFPLIEKYAPPASDYVAGTLQNITIDERNITNIAKVGIPRIVKMFTRASGVTKECLAGMILNMTCMDDWRRELADEGFVGTLIDSLRSDRSAVLTENILGILQNLAGDQAVQAQILGREGALEILIRQLYPKTYSSEVKQSAAMVIHRVCHRKDSLVETFKEMEASTAIKPIINQFPDADARNCCKALCYWIDVASG